MVKPTAIKDVQGRQVAVVECSTRMNQFEAEAKCSRIGGRLLDITDFDEKLTFSEMALLNMFYNDTCHASMLENQKDHEASKALDNGEEDTSDPWATSTLATFWLNMRYTCDNSSWTWIKSGLPAIDDEDMVQNVQECCGRY